MRSFTTAIACVFALATGVALSAEVDDRTLTLPRAAELVLLMFSLPAAVAWASARAVHTVRPCGVFLGSRGGFSACLGVGAGLMAVAATALVYLVTPRELNARGDAMIFCIVTALASAMLLRWFGGRPRAGFCAGCGYDISASLAFGRCPECGRRLAA